MTIITQLDTEQCLLSPKPESPCIISQSVIVWVYLHSNVNAVVMVLRKLQHAHVRYTYRVGQKVSLLIFAITSPTASQFSYFSAQKHHRKFVTCNQIGVIHHHRHYHHLDFWRGLNNKIIVRSTGDTAYLELFDDSWR